MEVRWAEYSSDTSKENTKESDWQSHRPPVFGPPVWKNNYFIYVTFILTPEQGLNWHFCVLRLWLHLCQGMKWDFTNQGMCTTPRLQYDLLKYVKYWKTLKRSWRFILECIWLWGAGTPMLNQIFICWNPPGCFFVWRLVVLSNFLAKAKKKSLQEMA